MLLAALSFWSNASIVLAVAAAVVSTVLAFFYSVNASRADLERGNLFVYQMALDSVLAMAREVSASRSSRLSEYRAIELCSRLLATMEVAIELTATSRDKPELSVMLLLPNVEGETRPTALRVWASSKGKVRLWSEVSLEQPGIPAAYKTGTTQIIPDLRIIAEGTAVRTGWARSVVAFPVTIQDPARNVLGVVVAECSEPHYFDIQGTVQIGEYLTPMIDAIAFILSRTAPASMEKPAR